MKTWTIEAWLPTNPHEAHDQTNRYTEEEAEVAALEMVEKHPDCRVYIRFTEKRIHIDCFYNQNGMYETTGRQWQNKETAP